MESEIDPAAMSTVVLGVDPSLDIPRPEILLSVAKVPDVGIVTVVVPTNVNVVENAPVNVKLLPVGSVKTPPPPSVIAVESKVVESLTVNVFALITVNIPVVAVMVKPLKFNALNPTNKVSPGFRISKDPELFLSSGPVVAPIWKVFEVVDGMEIKAPFN